MIRTLQLDGPAETTGAGGTLNFVSLAEVLVYLEQQSDSGGSFDTLVQKLIDSVSVSAFGLMNGRFLVRPSTEFDFVFTPEQEDVIFLPQYPVGTVSVVELGYMSANGTWSSSESVAVENYYVESLTGRIYGSWPVQRHSVRIKWPGGYTAAPEDAKEAAAKWVGVKLQRARVARWDVTSQTKGGTESATYTAELPPDVAAIWAKYATPGGSVA